MKSPKQIIHDYEYYQSGFHRLSGHGVKVLNVARTKAGYKADIVFLDDDNCTQRFNRCEYPMEIFKENHK